MTDKVVIHDLRKKEILIMFWIERADIREKDEILDPIYLSQYHREAA